MCFKREDVMMKRKLFIVIPVFLMCCFLLLSIGFVAENCKNNTETNQSSYEKTESIFVNELKDFDKNDFLIKLGIFFSTKINSL